MKISPEKFGTDLHLLFVNKANFWSLFLANFLQQRRDKTHEILGNFIKNFFSYLFALPSREICWGTGMNDALRSWEEVKFLALRREKLLGAPLGARNHWNICFQG